MKTRSRILRIALAVAFVLTCEAGTIADQVVTTSFDEVEFTSTPGFIKCNQASCTQACDRSATGTGHCVDMDAHVVQATTLECCCCVGFKHTKNLRFYPYN
jgi:hypothetical protein